MNIERVCIVGAGAIGGLLGGRLAHAGVQLSVLEIGERLRRIQADGLSVRSANGESVHARPMVVSDKVDKLSKHDLIILGVKAHDIQGVCTQLPSLFHEETVVLTVQNGLPWWYFQNFDGPFSGRRLETLDPGGMIERNIPIERIVGCVAYPAAELDDKGVVRLIEGSRFSVGEPSGEMTQRVQAIVDLLVNAGFKSFPLEDIRSELWLKAWGAVAFNPISALTRATMLEICQTPETRHLVVSMMREAEMIGRNLGADFRVPLEKRLAGAESVGHHKTSMLQDLEAGRQLESEAVISVVVELAAAMDVEIPSIRTVDSCLKLLQQTVHRKTSESL